MATELTIHIGPPKTGSTSLQFALARNRDLLRSEGVLYPESHGQDPNQQFAAAVDLAASSKTQMKLSRFSRALFDDATWYAGAWANLLEVTRHHDGPVIWSSEAFTYLDDQGVSLLADAVRDFPTKIVLTRRAISHQLVSAYVEHTRHDADSEPLVDTLQSALDVITNGIVATADLEHRNQGLSPCQVALWQAHLRRCQPRYYGAIENVLSGSVTGLRDEIPHQGGTCVAPQLLPSIARLVDEAFGLGGTSADRNLAREQIAARLDSDEPLTTHSKCTVAPRFQLGVLTRLRRRQRFADARWAVIDGVSRLVGRRRPLQIDWGAPSDWVSLGELARAD